MKTWQIILAGAVVLFLMGIWTGWQFHHCPELRQESSVIERHVDTVRVVVPQAPIAATKVRAKVRSHPGPPIVYVDSVTHDTIVAQPLLGTATQVIGCDTVELAFNFQPPMPPAFDFMLRRCSDTVVKLNQTTTITETRVRDPTWFEKAAPAIITAAVVAPLAYLYGKNQAREEARVSSVSNRIALGVKIGAGPSGILTNVTIGASP